MNEITLGDWLKKWRINLKFNLGFLQMDFKINEADKNAAWEMYIELLTRITTQALPPEHGDEQTALNSVYQLFPISREIIKDGGREAILFTKIAIVLLNQKIRPFTAKWHKLSVNGAFNNPGSCDEFRTELIALQKVLREYTKMLADIAGVEDLTGLEDNQ